VSKGLDLPVGVAIKCVENTEAYACYGCDFNKGGMFASRGCTAPEGLICGHFRKDKKDVIFKLIKIESVPVLVQTITEKPWRPKRNEV